MGFFSWLKPKNGNVEILNDLIWLSKEAKLAGIAASLSERLADPDRPVAVMLVAHFQDYLDELHKLAEEAGGDDCRVYAVLAADLKEAGSPVETFDESNCIDILVAERHPLWLHDERLLDYARAAPCHCRVVYHLSFDDALMRVFASERVENVLRNLGMSDDEPIKSRIVSRRVTKAQRKLQAGFWGDLPASSAQEWLEFNCPGVQTERGDR